MRIHCPEEHFVSSLGGVVVFIFSALGNCQAQGFVGGVGDAGHAHGVEKEGRSGDDGIKGSVIGLLIGPLGGRGLLLPTHVPFIRASE
ncbi:hypothetical protein EYF80_015899 [Liparis tanakae]|uniref:Secreted protein n=1 Tax=Liparis tanakae TaxID=230148 RepID=A0A4Z2I918_9TELE|nr:hypothetical protein EYF80_015899 [Liparis tanakae]